MPKFITFVQEVAQDPRIPSRDKKLLVALLALVISPIDLIPDWIPVIGLLDDVAYLALICDYLFNVLDEEILLSHYPWGLKSFAMIRRVGRVFAFLSPAFLRDKIWKFRPSPYSHKTI